MAIYEGLSLGILSKIENGMKKSDLKKRYGQWGGAQEKVFKKLVEKGILIYQNNKIEFTTNDLLIFSKKINMLENSIEDYISLLPEKNFIPWGIFVFLNSEKLWKSVENKIIHSIGTKNDTKTNIIWKVYKTIFDTGYANLRQITKLSNIYSEEISEVMNDLLIFPDLIKIKKVNGSQYLIFSRNFREWRIK